MTPNDDSYALHTNGEETAAHGCISIQVNRRDEALGYAWRRWRA
jgi:hypothetical protein